jgi:hypothetical protein
MMRDKLIEALGMMGEGKTLKQALTELGVKYTTGWTAIHADEELTELYARAREAYAHVIVQKLHEVAMNEPDVQRARLMCDNIKWEACKVLPKVYGDKQQLEHSGNITVEAVSYADTDTK